MMALCEILILSFTGFRRKVLKEGYLDTNHVFTVYCCLCFKWLVFIVSPDI